MFKNPALWTLSTAIITALVYIDTFFLGLFIFTIPMAVMVAIVAAIISAVQKKYVYVLRNLLLAIIACMSYGLFPW